MIGQYFMEYTKPELREKLKAKIMASSKGGDPGEWSARKSQLLVKEYEDAGGDYKGPKTSKQKSLTEWTKQDWRTSDGSPSEGKKRYLPDAAWDKLKPGEKAATSRAKAKGDEQGKQFVSQPGKIAKKTAKFR
jgi:hypothetical protein